MHIIFVRKRYYEALFTTIEEFIYSILSIYYIYLYIYLYIFIAFYLYTSFNPQNLRNIVKKVAKISIIKLLSNFSVKTTVFRYF